MFRRVVVPLDGSELAEQALEYGVALAERFGARLTLLRAFDQSERSARMLAMTPTEPVGAIDPRTVEALTEAVQAEHAEARTYLAGQAQRLTGRGLTLDTTLPDAGAAEAILAEAQREPDTVVVMSTHGRGGLGRLVFGSVAQEVLQNCHAPLLLIRVGEAPVSASGHDTGADVTIGADVLGGGEKLGEVHRVIVDANLNRVTAVAVKPGGLFGQERVLPMERISRIEGGVVYSDLDAAGFDALDRFVEERYRVPDAGHAGPRGLDRTQYLLDAYAAEGAAGALAGPPHMPPPPPLTGPDDIQVSALAAGMAVVDAEGEKVGEIGELSVSPDTGAPTRITLRRGLLFKRDTELPVDWIRDVSDEGVVLKVHKRDVEALE